MGDYGIRISKEGVDVKTGSDLDMILTSKYPLLKGSIIGSGSTAVTSGTIKTISITHNFGYIPFVNFYFQDTTTSENVWYFTPMGADAGAEHLYVSSYADSNKAYLRFDWWKSSGGTNTFNYKYYIFYDKAKL